MGKIAQPILPKFSTTGRIYALVKVQSIRIRKNKKGTETLNRTFKSTYVSGFVWGQDRAIKVGNCIHKGMVIYMRGDITNGAYQHNPEGRIFPTILHVTEMVVMAMPGKDGWNRTDDIAELNAQLESVHLTGAKNEWFTEYKWEAELSGKTTYGGKTEDGRPGGFSERRPPPVYRWSQAGFPRERTDDPSGET
jgi:single-stranded DNA-binding protein